MMCKIFFGRSFRLFVEINRHNFYTILEHQRARLQVLDRSPNWCNSSFEWHLESLFQKIKVSMTQNTVFLIRSGNKQLYSFRQAFYTFTCSDCGHFKQWEII